MSAPVVALTPRPGAYAPTSLRAERRALLLAAVLLAGWILLIYGIVRPLVIASAETADKQIVNRTLNRARANIAAEFIALERIARELAAVDPLPRPAGNRALPVISATTLAIGRLDLVLLADASGTVFDSRTSATRPALADRRWQAQLGPLLQTSAAQQGLVGTADGVLLIATTAIPAAGGWLVVGRYLEAPLVEQLAETQQTTIALIAPAVVTQQPTLSALVAGLNATTPIVTTVEQTGQARAVTWLSDVFGAPVLLLSVTEPAETLATSRERLKIVLVCGVLSVLAALALLMLGLRRRYRRYTALLTALTQAQGSPTAPVAVPAEIGAALTEVTTRVNALLAARSQELSHGGELLDMVCHELRTPLVPASGFVDLLLEDTQQSLSASQRSYLQMTRTYLSQMSVLVTDLLELSRVESGRAILNRELTEIAALFDEILAAQQPEITRKQMTASVVIEPPVDVVWIDRRRIGQVLTNLVSNAVKYTYPHGQIWLRAYQDAEQRLVIEVADTGIGMTTDQQRLLFTRFYRAESPLRDTVPGTGLGLTIARSFVEHHGGTLTLTSAPGIGSTFTITIPIVIPTQPASA
jgi:signal transduction histidine kinase